MPRPRVFAVIMLFAIGVVGWLVFGPQLLEVWGRREFPRQKGAVTDLQTLALALNRLAEQGNARYPMHPSVISTKLPPKFTNAVPKVWPRDVGQRIDAVAVQLAPYFANQNAVPVRDPWGHSYVYATTTDARHYVLISLGSDGRLNVDAPVAMAWDLRESWRDIVVADGTFVSYPYGISVAKVQRAQE